MVRVEGLGFKSQTERERESLSDDLCLSVSLLLSFFLSVVPTLSVS